jgi:hypothetical protein
LPLRRGVLRCVHGFLSTCGLTLWCRYVILWCAIVLPRHAA